MNTNPSSPSRTNYDVIVAGGGPAGAAVRIKRLCASPEVSHRLREIGFCEEQIIKRLTSQANIICLVCNARLAISSQLAQTIPVEPLLQPPSTPDLQFLISDFSLSAA